MISKIALIMAVALCAVASALLVDAQATVLTSPGSGRTSPVQGFPISKSQFANASGYGLYSPFAFTSAEIAATTDDLILVHTNGQSAKAFEWNIIWNFTTAESATIRTYFGTVGLRNNCEVRFTATWDASDRFTIDTTAWTFAFQSLMPYGMTPECNTSFLVANSRRTLGSLPGSCVGMLVPGQKQLAISLGAQCLLVFARTALDLNVACSTVRAFLETVYCTDGATGVDAVCSYNRQFLPSGVAGPVVLSVGADGLPTAGRADQTTSTGAPGGPGGAAGAISAFAVVVISAALMMLF